jgi:mono/diheme cytochrome c family protein
MRSEMLELPQAWLRRVLVVCLVLGLPPAVLAVPPTVKDRAEIRRAEATIAKAGNFYRAQKYRESGESAREAIAILGGLNTEDSPAWNAALATSLKQLARARELLAAQTVTVPNWKPGDAAPSAESVSFVREVVPILVAKCGGCHISRSQGQFSMANFTALEKGSASGVVFMAGDAAGSRLIEVIESGDMPRGGGEVTNTELEKLKGWIDSGAKFDGDDPSALLSSLAPGGQPERAPTVPVVMAGKNDKVQFARDIAPILVEHCLECHGQQNGGNGFSVASFDRLLQGGGNGPPVVVAKPAESLLIKKLRGTATLGSRMPQGRDPLSEETIAKFEAWIELGAKFDGFQSNASLEDTVAQRAAGGLSHEELAKQRLKRAENTWRLILPDTPANHLEDNEVLVVGGASPEILAAAKATADEQIVKLRKIFKTPDGTPLIRGRMTLFVFERRYDYGEVGTMLEGRELPATWHGHWMYNPLDPYGCVLLENDGTAAPGVVAQQIAGVYVASLGEVPRWFAEGSARAVAARIDPRDNRIHGWDQKVAEVLENTTQPESFLAGTLAPEEGDVLSYSFVSKLLMAPASRYVGVIGALQGGASFQDAFAKIYGGNPADLVGPWTTRVIPRRRK